MRRKGLPLWGNLRRLRPFSSNFGFDRGKPIDRYYLEKFLRENSRYISGKVLEIQINGYTLRFGKDISVTHTVDIRREFNPTYLCDLAECDNVIPDDYYDCFVMPNTLHHLQDLHKCLKNALRIVRPGGVILASASAFIPLVPDIPDYWRLSVNGWKEIINKAWAGCDVELKSYGNCLAVVASMLGLSSEELKEKELDFNDARYPVLITIFCRKPFD